MTPRHAAVVLVLAMLAGCASTQHAGPDGSTLARIEIDSSPTPAWIFVDGRYAGETPLSTDVPFTHAAPFLEIAAVPMYPTQARQVVRLQSPNLPKQVHFFLDNPSVVGSAN